MSERGMAGLPRTLSKADRAYHTGGVERLGEGGEQAREGDPVRAVGDAGSPVTGAADSVTGDEGLEIGAVEPEEVATRWRRGGEEERPDPSVRTRGLEPPPPKGPGPKPGASTGSATSARNPARRCRRVASWHAR